MTGPEMSDPALGTTDAPQERLSRPQKKPPLTFPAELDFWYLSWPRKLATEVLWGPLGTW